MRKELQHEMILFGILTLNHQPELFRDNEDDFLFKFLFMMTSLYIVFSILSLQNISMARLASVNIFSAVVYFLLKKTLGWVNEMAAERHITSVFAVIAVLLLIVILL